MFTSPRARSFDVFATLPAQFAERRKSAWADIVLAGRELACFLEGPVFDSDGNLLIADIPFGRIFQINPAGSWSLLASYDGWPNGMKTARDGGLLVADHKRGLLRLDPKSGAFETLLSDIAGAPLLGLNDLTIGPDASIYLTDQGNSGLHDPRGRVLRFRNGRAEVLLDNGPSPNGLVFDQRRNWLYVAMTRGNAIWRIPLVDDAVGRVGLAIQLSGGIGPDGIALDRAGRLLVVQAPLWVWQFDVFGRPIAVWEAGEDSYLTNLALREEGGRETIYVTDSINGRIMRADLQD